jgi:hypothetical protein
MTVTFVDFDSFGEVQTHAVIEHADGSFTSMPKAEYEAQQAEQSTPIVTDEAKTK